MTRVGFVGLGNIGKPMATRLVGWPGGLTVFDIAPADSADDTSVSTTRPPMSAATSCPDSALRSATTTDAPSAASARA
jgi:3-hydroxyisobutyrate dehydrogenase-like beta-hydroxyacid dehydrogenase